VRALLALSLVCAAGRALAQPASGVVATAEPPLDADRLADVLRVYLDAAGLEVRALPAAAAEELRAGIARGGGAQGVRALAALRLSPGAAAEVELALTDFAGGSQLVLTLPRPSRDEDLYRTVALKIQALLRQLSAPPPAPAPAAPAAGPPAGSLATAAPPAARPSRFFLEAGYSLVAFPVGAFVQQGALAAAGWLPRERLALTAGARFLWPVQRRRDEVTVLSGGVPLLAAVELRFGGPGLGGAAGADVEVTRRRLEASAPAGTPVRSTARWIPALGGHAVLSWQLASSVSLHLRAAALAVLVADRYTVRGEALLDTSRLEVVLDAGLQVGVF
jgi:hypothetical protein